MSTEEYVTLWEAPPVPKVEFRLYYDDSGKVLFYTCESPPGKYLVIDSGEYARSRMDIKVVDGKISTAPAQVIARLFPGAEGTRCAKEDVSIVAGPEYSGDVLKWELRVYEYS